MPKCECEELLKQGNSKQQYLLPEWVCTNGKRKMQKTPFYVVSLFMDKIIFSYCATKFLSIYELAEGLIKEHSLVHVKSRKRWLTVTKYKKHSITLLIWSQGCFKQPWKLKLKYKDRTSVLWQGSSFIWRSLISLIKALNAHHRHMVYLTYDHPTVLPCLENLRSKFSWKR